MDEVAARIKQLEAQLGAEIAKRKQLEAELQEALWRAAAAKRAKESFIANTNHELHTPLNAILGYTELLLEDVRSGHYGDVETDLSKIMEAGMRLLAIINELLDLSKIETAKMELDLEEFEISELVQRVVAGVRPLIEEQEDILSVQLDGVTTMTADAHKVRLILSNLLDNAAKFTASGQVTLQARPDRRDGRDGITFRVSDTGIGMIVDQTKNIFHAFTQADPSATRHYEGLGLGLYICWQFCRLMGGDISVKSEYGVGTTFTVWLPRRVSRPRPRPPGREKK